METTLNFLQKLDLLEILHCAFEFLLEKSNQKQIIYSKAMWL